MGFQQGLSGLNGAARNLDVIGNNISNASTVGFKMSRAEFADIYATSLTGAVGMQVGIGTKIAEVSQQFTQGNLTVTNNPLDLAVSGSGFYRMDQNGAISYQRNGQFQLDKEGYIVNSSGQKLTGFTQVTVDPVTQQVTSAANLGNLQLSTADLPAKATGGDPGTNDGAKVVANLDASKTAPTAAFNPTNSASYNDSTAFTIYDSLGDAHTLSLYFRKTGTNAWDVHLQLDGSTAAITSTNPLSLAFGTNGALTTAMPLTGVAASPAGAAALDFALDFTGTTQYGSAFGVTSISQNGYTSGRLAGFNVGENGVISGRYSNGQTQALGMVALANFANVQGLTAIGNNQWVQTADSGQELVGAPGSGTLGKLQSGAVEDANVDLTQELVNLIVAQRMYQANAQTVRAQDQILQTLVNLR